MKHRNAVFTALLACALTLGAGRATGVELKPNDHIALVGNALADRFQHSGWLETLLHARFPEHNLVVRNLAVSGDEITFRHRSENFGSPDEWLAKTKASVIFAFFGFNESFKGLEGLPTFKADLDRYLKETAAKNFSGQGGPSLVLFSPIANERHRDPNFPDPNANNSYLEAYTLAMSEVAKANGVQFIDLFTASKELYEQAAKEGISLTINGIHLSPEGDRRLALAAHKALFGEAAPAAAGLDKLRDAVNAKNHEWHQRYRTVDGYNVYGGRSRLSFPNGKDGPKITNYEVMQEEMSQRDVLTANRDKRVWAVARGGDLAVDDSNLPKVTEVQTNKPGPNENQSWPYLGGEEAIAKMKLHSGMQVNLFADEKQFPDLINPVQMAWDTRGRLWVAVWPNYPERTPTSTVGDSLILFEDTNGDGRADKRTVFADNLNAPTGFQFYKDGVLVVQAPDIWFMRDTDGDGKADWKERVLMGLDSADSHHTANAVCLDPGGAIYLSDGVFHRTQIETATGPVRNNDGGIFRYEPRTGRFETHVSYGFANPHGRVFDRWGNDLITDATGNNTYFGPAFSGHLDYPAKHSGMREFWPRPSRPCPATGILTSRHFPEEFQGNFLNLNVISFLGIFRVKVSEEGSGLNGETLEHLISSEDPNFRPIAISVGPDGAIYFCDWHNAIIGHMQHHLRDPNRDNQHGRIYRITYKGRDLLTPPKIHGQPIPALLELLKEPENQTRELAKVELGARDTKEVLAAVERWIPTLDKADGEYEHHMMEALWVHQWHNVVNRPLLERMLASPDHRARAAAARVLCQWRDRVTDSLGLFRKLAGDEHPRVRLEAVRAASFYREAAAAGVALAILKQPTDYYLDYTLGETMRQLDAWWRPALASGRLVGEDNPAGVKYLIGRVNTAELLQLPRTPEVMAALLTRDGVSDADRNLSLNGLAKARGTEPVALLVSMLESGDAAGAANLARLVPYQDPEDLKKLSTQLKNLAERGASLATRQAGWAGLALADDSFDAVWKTASTSTGALTDLLGGIAALNDPAFRTRAYPLVKPLLLGLPSQFEALASKANEAAGRFVRVELPRRGTLTLAEVQVFSGGQNIAPTGKATQSSTSNNGDASRAIDGGTNGSYGSGTQTHTEENQPNPWWELDLGAERPIESITIWNRTEGDLGRRLDKHTLVILDGARREIFRKEGLPAPAQQASVAVGSDPVGGLRRAAIGAIATMNEHHAAIFADLAAMIQKGDQVTTAARGLRVLPRATWPRPAAGAAALALVDWAAKVPAGNRTSQDYIETIQIASDLAGLLPPAQAEQARKSMKELQVAVFVLRTVREQMRYDVPRIVVEAGKPFEIILLNDDFMPHNLAVVKPGTRESVGMAAALMKPDQLDSQGRPYIPDVEGSILAATKLLESGQKETLKLTAPSKEGDYEYVCTFPGHHTLMWGWLIVRKDVDAYLKANPEAPATPAAATDHSKHHGLE